MRRILLLTAIGGFALVGCGDDDEGGAGDIERYCELTDELDRIGDEAFEGLDPDATEEDIQEAVQQLIEENEDRLDDLRDAAPPEIRGDLETLLDSIRSGELFSEDASEEVADAEQRVEEFESENCGPDEGD